MQVSIEGGGGGFRWGGDVGVSLVRLLSKMVGSSATQSDSWTKSTGSSLARRRWKTGAKSFVPFCHLRRRCLCQRWLGGKAERLRAACTIGLRMSSNCWYVGIESSKGTCELIGHQLLLLLWSELSLLLL